MKILETHEVQLWDYTKPEPRGPYGTALRQFQQIGPRFKAAVQHSTQRLGDVGPGETGVGNWKVYLKATIIRPRKGMVVQVVNGPNAPLQLKVEDDYSPRGKFFQLTCSDFQGALGDG